MTDVNEAEEDFGHESCGFIDSWLGAQRAQCPYRAIQKGYACCTSTTQSLVSAPQGLSFPNLQSMMVWAWACHIKSPQISLDMVIW